MVDAAPDAECYCTGGYGGYLDVVFPAEHIFNIHNKNDTLTVEGVNVDLRHYIPTLARRIRCFPKKLENLQDVLAVFVMAYNRLAGKKNFTVLIIRVPLSPFLSLISFNCAFGHSLFRRPS